MSKLDAFLLYSLSALFVTAAVNSFVKNIAASIFISFLIIVLFRTVFLHFFVRKRNKSVISVPEMETELSIMAGEQLDYFFSVVPSAFSPQKCECGFTYNEKNRLVFVAPNYKFSPSSPDDVAKFYRAAKKIKADSVTVLGRFPSRNVFVFAASLDILFKFIPSKKLHKFLLSQNALMPKRRKIKNPKKPALKSVFSGIFTKQRAKFFLLSGLSLSVFAFFGVMQAYYFVMCAICIICAIVCLLRKT